MDTVCTPASRRRPRAASLLLLLAAIAGHGQAPAQDVPRPSGREALGAAADVAAAARGKRGPERLLALEAGAKAYETVLAQHADDPGVAARAAWEAAELWRRHGTLGNADGLYRRALELDPARYEGRATLQLAHLLRRDRKHGDALPLYRRVAELEPRSARGHEARVWTGRELVALGQRDQAVEALRAAMVVAASPKQAVDAGNWLVKTLVAGGELDAARAALDDLEQQLREALDEGGPAAESLREALDEMTGRRALQRAVDKADGNAEAAARLESGGGGQRRPMP